MRRLNQDLSRNSLSLSSLAVLVLVMGLASDRPVLAGCATSTPIPAELAENNPVYAQLCSLDPPPGGGSPLPCPRPATPVVEVGSQRAQGMVLQVSGAHPEGEAIHAVWIEMLDGSLGRIWERRSVQGIPAGGLPSDPSATLRIGAPGLNADSGHYFRVAFEDSSGSKTCYSALGGPEFTTGFSTDGPALPASIRITMEDEFDRPATDPVHGSPAGDGIGPETVWSTSDRVDPSIPVQIAPDEVSARMPADGSIIYEKLTETDKESLAEVEIRVDLSSNGGGSGGYNFEVQARIGEPDPATGKAKAYAVKLAHVLRNCASPTLLIYRLPDETNPGCDAAQNPVPGGGVCDSPPPLDLEDPDKPGFSYPVRLRIYVSSNLEGEPIVQGQAYWTDPASGLAVTCSSPAEERVFVDDPGNMASVRGKWGAVVHERRYRLDLTRAGDSAASGQ